MFKEIIIGFMLASYCTAKYIGSKNNLKHNLTISQHNKKWLVAIFHIPTGQSPTDDPTYDYLCPGVLIHPKAVATLAHCWSYPSQTLDVVVRSYEWAANEIITQETAYTERAVKEILNFVSYDAHLSAAANINILVLDSAFPIGSMTIYIPFENYSKRRKFSGNECTSFHIQGNITTGLTLNKVRMYPTATETCCSLWQSISDDPAADMNKCMDKLGTLDCFNHVDADRCNHLDIMGSPVLCADEYQSEHDLYLRGFVSDRKNCKFVSADIGERIEWIGGELSNLINVNTRNTYGYNYYNGYNLVK